VTNQRVLLPLMLCILSPALVSHSRRRDVSLCFLSCHPSCCGSSSTVYREQRPREFPNPFVATGQHIKKAQVPVLAAASLLLSPGTVGKKSSMHRNCRGKCGLFQAQDRTSLASNLTSEFAELLACLSRSGALRSGADHSRPSNQALQSGATRIRPNLYGSRIEKFDLRCYQSCSRGKQSLRHLCALGLLHRPWGVRLHPSTMFARTSFAESLLTHPGAIARRLQAECFKGIVAWKRGWLVNQPRA